ncbi:hypothetical protein KL944_003183 [Ogataea haglerorum]|nr:hypothetical protein KL944_003183 [Ogataea haglerorum]
MSGFRGNGYGYGYSYRDPYYSRGRGRGGSYPYKRSYNDDGAPYESNPYPKPSNEDYRGDYPRRGGPYRGPHRPRGRGRGSYLGGYSDSHHDQPYDRYVERDGESRPRSNVSHSIIGSGSSTENGEFAHSKPNSRNGGRSEHDGRQQDSVDTETDLKSSKENHWVIRLRVTGETKASLSKSFDELDKINKVLAESAIKRLHLEMDVERYSRAGRSEDVRCRLAEEKLEALNFI